ncbi:transcriptional regulator [Antrihabitans spumae]|uniref:Transcriptional regulator n=1 Tax=Antrihabitans spumae TaxID=3373370 RepID=A0ABW7KPM1_9NOCA
MTSVPRRRRPALILLVVLVALGCLALGWWQWTRYEATGGTGQNLGYALQWPLFAAFSVYAYRRFVQLEEVAAEPESAANTADRSQAREIPADILPPRPAALVSDDIDPATSEYNRYLAELHAGDTDRSTA